MSASEALSGVQFFPTREVSSWRSGDYQMPASGVHEAMIDDDLNDVDPHIEKVQELASSMRSKGFDPRHPITAGKDQGHPRISDGNHRLVAAREAGLSHVAVKLHGEIKSLAQWKAAQK